MIAPNQAPDFRGFFCVQPPIRLMPLAPTELQQALLIFGLGGLVTLATVVMILRGHRRWHRRDPFDDPSHD
ncbi:conserved protein of unknown function [Cyanobium sp. NIES-981]|nr:conserved protein of unknown function [Cyanobium sp. NIES-981]